MGLAHLRVEGRVVLHRHRVSEGVPETPWGIGHAHGSGGASLFAPWHGPQVESTAAAAAAAASAATVPPPPPPACGYALMAFTTEVSAATTASVWIVSLFLAALGAIRLS